MIKKDMHMEHNHAAQSQLAKLLASENITVRHDAKAQTAAFDVKNRVLILPIWRQMSKDLYDMLIIHEVGHALDTPCDGWQDAIKKIASKLNGDATKGVSSIKGFLNVVEDARIDKRQKRRYPGSRRNYVIGMKELIDNDFFGTKGRDLNTLSFIDRMNIFFKGGAMLGIKFAPAEKAFLKRAEMAETWDEVVALTEDIYAYAKANKDLDQSLKSNDMGMSDEDGDDYVEEDENWRSGDNGDWNEDDEEDDTEDGSSAADDSDDEADETDGDGDGDSDDDSDDANADKSSKSDKNDGDKQETSASGDDNLPESETDKSWEEKRKQLNAQNSPTYVYVTLPTPNLSRIVDDYKKVMADWREHFSADVVAQSYNKFKSEENAAISFMIKEFESRKAADVYQRTSIAKTGVIDTNKLHSYRYNDDIFRKLSVVAEGKNHGFVMFLDWSGSMDHRIKETIRQLASIALFCKRVQIPFEVYTFRTALDRDGDDAGFWNMKDSDVTLGNLKIRNILSSRMSTTELNFAFGVLLYAGGRIYSDPMHATPLNSAVVVAPYIVENFRNQNKLQVVNTVFLTDGDSDPVWGWSKQRHDYNRNGYKFVLTDDKTKREYMINNGSNMDVTSTLLSMLKDRTDCNLIGFFLADGRFGHLYSKWTGSDAFGVAFEKSKKLWEENNFVGVSSAGYDQYFLVNASKLGDRRNTLNINSDMSKARIAKEFMKFSEKKTVNRVLLRNFIDLVAA